MIPISITMQAFGPYKERKFIDFERLNEKGLFLITGNTGSGKTTILDAMCMSLYCRSTGGLRTFKELRNVSCGDELDTLIEFVFLLNDKMYKFQRTLGMHSIRRKDKKELRDEHSCWEKKNGNWILIKSGSESKVRNAAQEIIGLDCEQFSKVIVLPQGEFRNLLLASSSEKSKIFTALFDTDKYNQITNEIQKMSDELKLKLNQYLLIRDNILNSNSVCCMEELQEKIINTDDLLKIQKQEQKRLTKQIDVLKEKIETEQMYEAIKNEVDEKYREKENINIELKEAEEIFNENKNHEDKIIKLKQDHGFYLKQITKLNDKLKKAKRYTKMQDEKVKCQELLNAVTSELTEINSKVCSLEDVLKQNKVKEDLLRKTVENLTNTYVNFQKLQKENEQFFRLEDLKNKMKEAENEYQQIDGIYSEEGLKLKILQDRKKDIEKFLFSEECVKIAERLIPNEPCPVCGSLKHPCTANKKNEGHQNLSEELKTINKLVEMKEKNLKELKDRLEDKKINFISAKEAYAYQNDICGEIKYSREDHLKALIKVTKQLEFEKKADEKLKKLQVQNDIYKNDFEKMQRIFCEYNKKKEAAIKAIEVITAQQQLLLEENPCLNLQSIEYELKESMNKIDECENLQKKLEEKIQKSKIAFEVCISRSENAQHSYNRSRERLQQVLEKREKYNTTNLNEDKSNLQKLMKENNILIESTGGLMQTKITLKNAESQIIKLNKDKEYMDIKYSKIEKLSQLLSGANPLKIPLKIFVLGIMLDDVLCHANIYFSQFSNSRYSLSRACNSIGRGYNGLDIDVFDAYYGSVRPVKTLSGGELFLASLSLAFGLSDVIQSYSGGIRLNSIFIDEGFGSLDIQTLETAMDAFSKVIKNGRIIGIISHVDELKNRIEAKIQLD